MLTVYRTLKKSLTNEFTYSLVRRGADGRDTCGGVPMADNRARGVWNVVRVGRGLGAAGCRQLMHRL